MVQLVPFLPWGFGYPESPQAGSLSTVAPLKGPFLVDFSGSPKPTGYKLTDDA